MSEATGVPGALRANPHRPDRTTIDYFRRIEGLIQKKALAESDAKLVLSDLVEEKGADLEKTMCDVLCSRTIEQIIPLLTQQETVRLTNLFSSRVAIFAVDRHASHVLETALVHTTVDSPKELNINHNNQSNNQSKRTRRVYFSRVLLNVVRELFISKEAIANLAKDAYGSHVLRTVLVHIGKPLAFLTRTDAQKHGSSNGGGDNNDDENKIGDEEEGDGENDVAKATWLRDRASRSQDYAVEYFADGSEKADAKTRDSTIAELKKLFKRFSETIFENFATLCVDDFGSFVVQALVEAVPPPKMPTVIDAQSFSRLVNHEKGAFVLQKLAECVPSKRWFRFIKDNIADYASSNPANFVVQSILEHQQLSFKEKHVMALCEGIAASRRRIPSQVYQKVVSVMSRYLSVQQKYAAWIVGVADSTNDAFLKTAIAESFVLEFVKEPDCSMEALCNPSGSRMFESFLRNPHIPFIAKQKVIQKLKGHIAALACDKFGSRVVERAFGEAEDSKRKFILKELEADRRKLERDRFARFVVIHCMSKDAEEEAKHKSSVKRELQQLLLEEEQQEGQTARKKARHH
eukprot:ANDGO_02191.mRNA.1 hypothetical protein DFA_05640